MTEDRLPWIEALADLEQRAAEEGEAELAACFSALGLLFAIDCLGPVAEKMAELERQVHDEVDMMTASAN